MRNKIPYILSAILVVGAVCTWVFFTTDQNSNKENPELTSAEKTNGTVAGTNTQSENRYHSAIGFSFEKPSGFNVGEFEEEGHIILVQGQNPKHAFQILISFFDEANAVITKERILTDIPGMKVTESRSVILSEAKDPVKGLAFESDNEVFGNSSYEVWFVKGTNLYQITGYKESKPFIEQIISSWKFE